MSPVESATQAMTYVRRQYDRHGDKALMGVGFVAGGAFMSAFGTSLLAGKHIITLIDLSLIAAGTTTAAAAVIGPVTIALSAAAIGAAYMFTTFENTKEFLAKWTWIAFVPMVGMAWAASTTLVTVVALSLLSAVGAFGVYLASEMFGEEDPSSGNVTDEMREARREADRAEQLAARAARRAADEAARAARTQQTSGSSVVHREVRDEEDEGVMEYSNRDRAPSSLQGYGSGSHLASHSTSTSRGGFGGGTGRGGNY
ncbi:MAG TPA: hypothetical protein VIJ46_01810 [Rhabdochlamydiaceae bacterium]